MCSQCQVKTLETGEIDYDELRAELVKNKGRPAILNVNIGTTVKGAVDDLDRVSHGSAEVDLESSHGHRYLTSCVLMILDRDLLSTLICLRS